MKNHVMRFHSNHAYTPLDLDAPPPPLKPHFYIENHGLHRYAFIFMFALNKHIDCDYSF